MHRIFRFHRSDLALLLLLRLRRGRCPPKLAEAAVRESPPRVPQLRDLALLLLLRSAISPQVSAAAAGERSPRVPLLGDLLLLLLLLLLLIPRLSAARLRDLALPLLLRPRFARSSAPPQSAAAVRGRSPPPPQVTAAAVWESRSPPQVSAAAAGERSPRVPRLGRLGDLLLLLLPFLLLLLFGMGRRTRQESDTGGGFCGGETATVARDNVWTAWSRDIGC